MDATLKALLILVLLPMALVSVGMIGCVGCVTLGAVAVAVEGLSATEAHNQAYWEQKAEERRERKAAAAPDQAEDEQVEGDQ
jgi:hypothetical protein